MTASRIDNPVLYRWDLNENSTRYDYARGRPEDEVLQIQFSILAFVNAVVAVATLILIIAILKSRNLRSNAFNLYIVFMAIPDFIGSFLCLLTCAMSAPGSDFYSEAMCGFQAFYLIFAFAGNAWTNVIIFHQVKKLLEYSKTRRRYFPPTRRQVFCHVGIVYTYALIWAALMTFPIQGMPIQTKLYYGFACMPMEQDETSSLFLYLVLLPGILLIPFLYTVYVMGRILMKEMLPTEGKLRNLAIFLIRLILLYFFGWLPFLILSLIGNFVQLGPWWFWVGAVISHFQGFVTAVVVYYTSKSIKREMKKIWWCNCEGSAESLDGAETSTYSSFFRKNRKSPMVSGSLGDGRSQSVRGILAPKDNVSTQRMNLEERRRDSEDPNASSEDLIPDLEVGDEEVESSRRDSEDPNAPSEDLIPDLEGGDEEVESA